MSGSHRLLAGLTALTLTAGASAALLAPGPAAALSPTCTPSASWGSDRADQASEVIRLVNEHRATKGLAPLAASTALTASATWKSLHMAGYGYFAHNDPAPPVARDPFLRMTDCGDPANGARGENIAAGYTTPGAVVSAWLGSSGHRQNIESPAYRAIGVGVAHRPGSPYGWYWTQDFGSTADPAPAPPPPAPPPPAPGGTTVDLAPASATIETGRLVRGGAASLAAQDGSALEVQSSRGVTSWYGTFTGVPRTTTRLVATFAGSATDGCTQVTAAYDWTAGSWATLDSRAASRTAARLQVTVSANVVRHVSSGAATGSVRVRVRCSASSAFRSFTSAGDQLQLSVTG